MIVVGLALQAKRNSCQVAEIDAPEPPRDHKTVARASRYAYEHLMGHKTTKTAHEHPKGNAMCARASHGPEPCVRASQRMKRCELAADCPTYSQVAQRCRKNTNRTEVDRREEVFTNPSSVDPRFIRYRNLLFMNGSRTMVS
jgi:hypothetical protein